MKRYACYMNDGEFIMDFWQKRNAKKLRDEMRFKYISRYVIIYDSKKKIYI